MIRGIINFLNFSILGRMVCFWRPGQHELNIADIDPNLCSHILVTFLSIDASGGLPNQEYIGSKAEEAINLRSKNKNPKIFASIASPNLAAWQQMAANSTSRQNFANNIFNFLQTYDMDGIGKTLKTSHIVVFQLFFFYRC
jgi:chitinase